MFLLILCSFIYIVIGTIPGFGVTMNYVSWFIILYFIGSYIRLYDKKIFCNTKFWGWSAAAMLVLAVSSVVGMTWLADKLGVQGGNFFFLSDSNKILAVLLSISAFMFFKNVKMKNSKFVNTVAASVFGVLMIHANSDTMRRWLWQDVLDNVGVYDSQWLAVHAVVSVIVIYTVCTVIDYLRIRYIENPFLKLWDKHWDKIKDKYIEKESKVCKTLQIKE